MIGRIEAEEKSGKEVEEEKTTHDLFDNDVAFRVKSDYTVYGF